MNQRDIKATVIQTGNTPETWTVEGIDMPEGDCFVATFSGPDARGTAEEYARAKYADFCFFNRQPEAPPV